jgi:hypothetical protein
MIIIQGMNNLQQAFIPRALGQVVEEALRPQRMRVPALHSQPIQMSDQGS